MRRMIILNFLILALVIANQMCRSGNFVVDHAAKVLMRDDNKVMPLRDTTELIVNGGFETGTLPPWQSSVWVVTTIQPHNGQYCAADVGNNWIRQDITPVLTDSIRSITFWSRQPEEQIQAFDFIFSDNTYFEDIIWSKIAWQQFDVTAYLPSGKTMVALRLWGYSGGPPQPDSTYIDDISILAQTPVKIEEEANALLKPVLHIQPNPARAKVVIEFAASDWKPALLRIYDAKGALVRTANLNNGKYIWHTNGFSPGVYFVRITGGYERQCVKKVLLIGR